MYLSLLTAAVGFLCRVDAHGDHAHSQKPLVPEGADWTTRHMIGRQTGYQADRH